VQRHADTLLTRTILPDSKANGEKKRKFIDLIAVEVSLSDAEKGIRPRKKALPGRQSQVLKG
jgi:hypothetical protein